MMTQAESTVEFIKNLLKDGSMSSGEKLQYIAVAVGTMAVDEIDEEIRTMTGR